MKSILLTRPEEAAQDFMLEAQQITEMPLINAPMTRIEMLDAPLPDINGFAGLVFTSMRGVRAFAARSSQPAQCPVFVTGDQPAQDARQAGFADIINVQGTAAGIVPAILENGPPGKYLHPCGVHMAVNLQEYVRDTNIEILGLPLYTARKVHTISPESLSRLKGGDIEAVLFFSARAGEQFAVMAQEKGFAYGLRATNALCLSARVLKSIKQLPWHNMYISPSPDRKGMLGLLRDMYG
jgi:uroporphyrinogen-III synthase